MKVHAPRLTPPEKHMTETATATAAATETKRCTRCGERKSGSEFRQRQRGSGKRCAECRQCHNLRESIRIAKKRGDSKYGVLLRQLRRIEESRCELHLMVVVEECLTQFGGPEGFARELWATYDRSKQSLGSNRVAFRVLETILKLSRANEDRFCGDG